MPTLTRLTAVSILVFAAATLAESAARVPATVQTDYHGNFALDFPPFADRVRLLAKDAPLQIATQLGLVQFKDDFQYPVTIRFGDRIRFTESNIEPGDVHTEAPASLRFYEGRDGYRQDLVFNMEWYARHPQQFDSLFRHEMTHVVLNDAAASPDVGLDMPRWAQEGLALWVSGRADDVINAAIDRELFEVRASSTGAAITRARRFSRDIDAGYAADAEAMYALAIRYIESVGGINALQQFARDLVAGKSLDATCRETLSQTWPEFRQNARAYAAQAFRQKTSVEP